MRRWVAVSWVLALLTGCDTAQLSRDAGPGGTAGDASPQGDAGEAPDARLADLGPPDAGPEVLLEEDFDTDPLAGDTPRWSITHPSSDAWSWDAARHRLRSGPGASCVYWGNRVRETDRAVYCEQGPAMIHSPSFPVGDGRLTIELEMEVETATAGHAASMVLPHLAADVEPAWQILPDGSPEFTDVDFLAWIGFVPLPGSAQLLLGPASRLDQNLQAFPIPELATRVAYVFHIETCTDQLRVAVTPEGGRPLPMLTIPADVSPGSHYERVYLLFMAEGPEKSFDSVRVTRGCTGD